MRKGEEEQGIRVLNETEVEAWLGELEQGSV